MNKDSTTTSPTTDGLSSETNEALYGTTIAT